MKRITLATFITVFILVGCSTATPQSTPEITPTALQKIRLPMGFQPNIQYAPFYVATTKGYFQEAGLDIEFDYRPETDGVALVGAGELPFAIVSGEQVLLARAQQIPVVYVLAWWHDYPVAITAKQIQNIQSPADLRGKRIGLPGLFGASYIGLRALLEAGGLTEQDVTLDSIGYNQVEALTSDQEDAVVIYANNEPIQLAAQGYELNTLAVKDYVQLASNGMITNENLIANDPDLIRRMNQAILKGIADTIANPAEAYEISKAYVVGLDQLNPAIQMDILNSSIGYWITEQPGVSQPAAWENMQKVLLDTGLLNEPLDLTKAFTNEFVKP
ncbi:MAG: hypothetical protein H6Q38_48 [Chloroflexi bacterium]|nr:hypothetical protein [Chloroflexota bacterium]